MKLLVSFPHQGGNSLGMFLVIIGVYYYSLNGGRLRSELYMWETVLFLFLFV